MSRTLTIFSSSLLIFCSSIVADEALGTSGLAADHELITDVIIPEQAEPFIQNQIIQSAPIAPKAKPAATKKKAEAFKPFTGKISGKKVRMRALADTESPIISEFAKGELISVVGEKGDFWAVEPPTSCKAYIFRSFVLDGKVEGNRVNVRLQPNMDAPIVAHLNAGDAVDGHVSPINNKWLQIAAPKGTHFYIAKDYVKHEGGPELKTQLDRRKTSVEQILEAASVITKGEMKKSFDHIDLDKLTHSYKTIIEEYSDFPQYVEKAQSELAALQEEYLQKRIAFLEEKASGVNFEQEVTTAASPEQITDRMKMWDHVEEALYLSWTANNDEKSMQQYYDEQKLSAIPLTGILETYQTSAKSVPGDFILRDQSLPKACLYSSKVNLQKFIGKKVTLYGVPRPNNNFAFPAYYIVDAE